jgi:hypothetical protein
VIGVVSKSTKQSIRLYNGRSRYSDWQFVYTDVSNRGGAAAGTAPTPGQGASRPGMPPGGRSPGGGQGRPGFPSGAPSGFPRGGPPSMTPGGPPP